MTPETLLSPSAELSGKEKAKERDREEREKKKFKDRDKEKKKHKVVKDIKRENGEVKQPIKGWWKHTRKRTQMFVVPLISGETTGEAASAREEVLGLRI